MAEFCARSAFKRTKSIGPCEKSIKKWSRRETALRRQGPTDPEEGETLMATNLVRFDNDGAAKWGVVAGSGLSPLEGDYPTTAALIERGEADWRVREAEAANHVGPHDKDLVARYRAVPHLLPGRELSTAHDRIRNGSRRKAVQHVLHEVGRVDRVGARRCHAAEARGAHRLRDRARARLPSRDRQTGDGDERAT